MSATMCESNVTFGKLGSAILLPLILGLAVSGCARNSLSGFLVNPMTLTGYSNPKFADTGLGTGQKHCTCDQVGCGCCGEPAYFGYSATCWRTWPEDWIGCPYVIEEPLGDALLKEPAVPETTVAPQPTEVPSAALTEEAVDNAVSVPWEVAETTAAAPPVEAEVAASPADEADAPNASPQPDSPIDKPEADKPATTPADQPPQPLTPPAPDDTTITEPELEAPNPAAEDETPADMPAAPPENVTQSRIVPSPSHNGMRSVLLRPRESQATRTTASMPREQVSRLVTLVNAAFTSPTLVFHLSGKEEVAVQPQQRAAARYVSGEPAQGQPDKPGDIGTRDQGTAIESSQARNPGLQIRFAQPFAL
jgi:hypothetical protein